MQPETETVQVSLAKKMTERQHDIFLYNTYVQVIPYLLEGVVRKK